MRPLVYDFNLLCQKARGGAINTRRERRCNARAIAKQLDAKFRGLRLENVSERHLDWYIEALTTGQLSANGRPPAVGTVKNRMAVLRFILRRAGKEGMLPADNSALGIQRRTYVRAESIAVVLTPAQLLLVDQSSNFYGASLRLMAVFGLRHEEAQKIVPIEADHRTELVLQGNWCKNGKPRSVPIRTRAQRDALDYAKAVAHEGSLVPPAMSYVQSRRKFQSITKAIGIGIRHALRHNFAQVRYAEICGEAAPVVSGLKAQDVSPDRLIRDRCARDVISRELGHERRAVLGAYLGSLFKKQTV